VKCPFLTTEKDKIDEAKDTYDLRPGGDGCKDTRRRSRDPIEYGCFGATRTSH